MGLDRMGKYIKAVLVLTYKFILTPFKLHIFKIFNIKKGISYCKLVELHSA